MPIVAFGETGNLASAPWIGDGRPERNGADWYEEDPAPEFCAEFVLPPGVTETRIRFACAGYGWFSACGVQMNANGLEPMWSAYDKTIYATATPVLRPVGKSRVIVRLGNGFYNLPPLRFWGKRCFRNVLAHGRPCFKMSIDGVKEPLVWKWRKTNVIRNSVYLGTEIDATRPEDVEWRPAAVVEGPKGRIVEWPRQNPRTSDGWAREEGKSRWLREGAVQVVDFGTNASGVPEFVFRNEKKGARIEIVYGERLNADGSVNVLTQAAGQIKRARMGGPGAPRIACQRDAYVCRGCADGSGGECFRPPFTWHVFRYAEIRGATRLLEGRDAVRGNLSMFPVEAEPGTAARDFKTGNADFMRIHEMCRRTFRANLIGGIQSDCPGRERLGYGGDIVSSHEAMMLNFNMKELYLKILQDFADEAADDGWLTETAPYVGIRDAGFGGRAGPIVWTVAVPQMIDGIIRHYPDAKDRALAFYPVCTRYVALVDAVRPSGIIPHCIGDHEALERAPNAVTATVHWHEFVRLTAKFAALLGKTDEQAKLEALSAKIRGAFQAGYVKDGIVANGTQSAQAMALYFGLVPSDQVAAAEAQLMKAIEEKGFAVSTGIYSTRYMLMYLSEHGRRDVAERIVLHRGFPGWLHMLERGATTIWETWKESSNTYSNCHPMFGSVDEWILKYGQCK